MAFLRASALAFALPLLVALATPLAACSDREDPPPPSDLGVDAGPPDASANDAAVPDDAATPDDANATDAGPAPVCAPELGATCSTATPCAATYDCTSSRCVPQGRPTCGGFAGALCPGAGGGPTTECLYYAGGSDYGPCFTPAERACICARAVPGFVCP
jgi:hypothetical protein